MNSDTSGFEAFDRLVQDASSARVDVLCDAISTPALMAHAMRRLRATRDIALMGKMRTGCSPWQEIATRLELGALPGNPIEAARLLSDALTGLDPGRAAVLLERPEPDTFDARISARVSSQWPGTFVTVGPAQPLKDVRVVSVPAELAETDKVHWLHALTGDHAQLRGSPTLAQLEAWWRRVRIQERSEVDDVMSEELRDVLVVLALTGRSLHEDEAARIPGFQACWNEARARGMITLFDRFVQVAYEWSTRAESWAQAAGPWALREARSRIASSRDPWARMQDATLAARLGDLDASATSFAEVLRGSMDPHLRAEFHRRLLSMTVHQDPSKHRSFALKVARSAVDVGDHTQAEEWVKVAQVGGSLEGAFVLGRAALGRGDLAGAKAAFERARMPEGREANDTSERALHSALSDEAIVGLAETLVQLGQTERALGLAAEVVARKLTPMSLIGRSEERRVGKEC